MITPPLPPPSPLFFFKYRLNDPFLLFLLLLLLIPLPLYFSSNITVYIVYQFDMSFYNYLYKETLGRALLVHS